ncbi:MAG TPA: polyhydroxyalkanoate synthesis regulator DNA-binding domain-containing protein [Myxococcota bacterium]|nr:polyhydroxyalkanoate synthesis regulator DNA-binding domain-containing protein [Myxococcota bacterium]
MAVLIKRYANRKLYNTQSSRYITLKGIADLLEGGEEVRVVDNESGEDITSITLSQILVDTERANRAVPGNLLSGLFQRGGDALYEALSRGVDDASERLEDFQRTMRKLLRVRHEQDAAAALDGVETGDRARDWIAFSPPDLDQLVQRAIERVLKMLDLPTRSDIDALNARLDRLTEALGERVPPRPPRETPAPPAHVESDPD